MAPETSYFTRTHNLKLLQQDVQIGGNHAGGTRVLTTFRPSIVHMHEIFYNRKFNGTLKLKSLLPNEEDNGF